MVDLNTTDITEFDCVTIGDHSKLNASSCPQAHLFEDPGMKFDHANIGGRVYMGAHCFVLYGAEVEDNARLGALTLIKKGEYIPTVFGWRGCLVAPTGD